MIKEERILVEKSVKQSQRLEEEAKEEKKRYQNKEDENWILTLPWETDPWSVWHGES